MHGSFRILALCAGALGCTDDPTDSGSVTPGVAYRLQLLPILPTNQQQLLSDVATVTLTVQPDDGEATVLDLSAIDGGFSADQLDLIASSVLTLEAFDDNARVTGWGQPPLLDITDGDERIVQFLVAAPDTIGDLPALPEPITGGALSWDGAGRFLLFGGGTLGTEGNRSGLDTVWALDTTSDAATDRFVEVGSMPAIDSEGGVTGRYGHTATLLTGAHADQGRILVVGGGADFGGTDVVSDQVFLWDPADDRPITLDADAQTRRATFLHDAIEGPDGNVVIIGGFPQSADQRSYLFGEVGSFYRAADRETESLRLNSALSAYTLAAGARIDLEGGPRGVLVCGGADLTGDNLFQINSGCDLVGTDGEVTPLDGGGDQLLSPVFHHAMTPLPDGTVLLTGGLVTTEAGDLPTNATLDATNGAWIYDGDTWAVAPDTLRLPRAMHEAVPLPDGRVLIYGGVSDNRGLFWTGDSAVACGEIYDPGQGTFTLVDDCAAVPAAWPMAATDPLHGTLVVGGLDADDASVDDAVLYYADSPLSLGR